MRKINEIILHCSATEAGKMYTAEDINRWHKQRGFDCIGYHFVIRLNGVIESGRALSRVGAHCIGHNKNSIGICYIGGLKLGIPSNTLTFQQIDSLRKLLAFCMKSFDIPKENIHLHNEFAKKDCPCFSRLYLNEVLLSFLPDKIIF